ncbi:MAG: MFS transporter [Alphaproteobacteria bacterium]|nr:MFS transporter [Alphaproteobacteria bacterium]
MSVTVPSDISEVDSRVKKNAVIFAFAQAMYGSQAVMLITTGGLIGKALANDPGWATLPISAFVIGTMLTALPASLYMKLVGRKIGFLTGAACGVFSALLGLYAIYIQDFWLFTGAMMLTGSYQAFAMLYRFAAADLAGPEFKAKAISWVTIGGLVSGIVGPIAIITTQDILGPVIFGGCYVVAALMATASAVALLFLDRPDGEAAEVEEAPRPLSVILRQPALVVAVVCAMMSYGMMNLVMTATPLAMVGCGFSVDTAALVIQWHVLAMYAPSFFTGSLINRFGARKVIGIGMVLLTGAGISTLSGLHLANFGIGLVLLGVGWNFGFVGATAMLTGYYRPAEKNIVQGINDFCVFTTVAIASLSSGKLLHLVGWNAVNIALYPMIAVTLALLLWLTLHLRRPQTPT